MNKRFPRPVRTLDALHLASALYLHDRDPDMRLATCDERLAVGIPAYQLDTRDS